VSTGILSVGPGSRAPPRQRPFRGLVATIRGITQHGTVREGEIGARLRELAQPSTVDETWLRGKPAPARRGVPLFLFHWHGRY